MSVFLSSFDHIDNTFYEESKMRKSSVNLTEYHKKTHKDDNRRTNELKGKVREKKLLDFGCEAGGFLKLISKYASEAVGLEIDKMLNQKLNDEGILCYSKMMRSMSNSTL